MSTRAPKGPDLHDRNGSHLEALFRKEQAYLADAGFTEGVMRALPPAAKGRRWRAVILAAAALMGALVGALVLRDIAFPAPGHGLTHWLWQAFTWMPANLALALPLPPVPLVLGLVALTCALVWTRASSSS